MTVRRSVRDYDRKLTALIQDAEADVETARRRLEFATAKLDALKGALELSGGTYPPEPRPPRKKKTAQP